MEFEKQRVDEVESREEVKSGESRVDGVDSGDSGLQ